MADNVLSEYLETYFDEVTPIEFYRDIFPAGELEKQGQYVKGKYCGIAVEITGAKKPNGKPLIKRYSITDELSTIDKLTESNSFCLCSPISYAGKERTADNARFMYAIAVDLDKVLVKGGKPAGLMTLWNVDIEEERIPRPTYIVSSGTGLHLYYVLEKPVALFQDTAKQLQDLKHELTDLIWGYGIVDIKDRREIQQEGIYQGFRMPGTVTKNGSRARAFLTGKKTSIEALNEYIPEALRVKRYTVKKELTRQQAKELYPEWYERRIEKKQPPGVWHISRRLYDWWKREIIAKGVPGHRYWCMMTLSVYAYKCGMYDPKHNPDPVTREELERDCFEIMKHFDKRTIDDNNHFTEIDVQDALEAYDNKWVRYPRDTIEYRCGFPLPHNKRNGQPQALHLEEARAIRDIRQRRQGKKWSDNSGRKPKQDIVEQWQQAHPNGKKIECYKQTGLSRPTIDKYWKTETAAGVISESKKARKPGRNDTKKKMKNTKS